MRLLLVFIALTSFTGTSPLFSQDLNSFQEANRLLILKGENLESDWLQAQLKRLNSNSAELIERDLIVLLLANNLVYDETQTLLNKKADSIVSKYRLENFEGLILIGKDDQLKLKEEFIVSPSRILNLIDSMPMRISEMKNKN